MRIRRPSPWKELTREHGPLLALVLVMFAVYGLQGLFGEDWYGPLMAVPQKITHAWDALREGRLGPDSWKAFATLITAVFLHADGSHIVYNMLYLWIFGAATAELIGHRWLLLIFFITGICGSIFHTVLHADEAIPCLGASGAVMGFEGAYLGLTVRWRLPYPHVWPIAGPIPPERLALLAVVGVVLDLSGTFGWQSGNTAYGAHIGGFVSGLLLTAVAAPKPRLADYRH